MPGAPIAAATRELALLRRGQCCWVLPSRWRGGAIHRPRRTWSWYRHRRCRDSRTRFISNTELAPIAVVPGVGTIESHSRKVGIASIIRDCSSPEQVPVQFGPSAVIDSYRLRFGSRRWRRDAATTAGRMPALLSYGAEPSRFRDHRALPGGYHSVWAALPQEATLAARLLSGRAGYSVVGDRVVD